MPQFTLDYSGKPGFPPTRPARRWSRRRVTVALRRGLLRLGFLSGLLAVFWAIWHRTETHRLRTEHDARLLQYDSLLAAKLTVERQLVATRADLLRLRLEHAAMRQRLDKTGTGSPTGNHGIR